MFIPELIRKKRDGGVLSAEELTFIIEGYLAGTVDEYQVSALLMAIFFKGMEPDEAATLTKIMMNSGRTYDLSPVPGHKVDKHSTGGVGDKVSLILAPLIAAAGLVDPMVSGRGLGHSGGTLDKLDSIPGYRWDLSEKELLTQLEKIGCAIIGQTDDFVPADKRIYALRDVTATVECIPLICASILSKKAASGTQSLVMDVKCGSGAFMDSVDRARELADALLRIGKQLGLNMSAMLTQMNQPLGIMVGNALEVRESIDVLKGHGPEDTWEVTRELAADMYVLGGVAADLDSARQKAEDLRSSGAALEKFTAWVEAQGGDPRIVDSPNVLAWASDRELFRTTKAGTITAIDTRTVGVAGNMLGAGRMKTTDEVDPAVGLEMHAVVGTTLQPGDPIATIHHSEGRGLDECKRLLTEAFTIGEESVAPLPAIIERRDA